MYSSNLFYHIYLFMRLSNFSLSLSSIHLLGREEEAGHGRLPTPTTGKPVSLAMISATRHSQL
jgi:hypothetical protein